MMKKVLIVSYAFPPLNIAGSFRPLKFVKNLPNFGWTVAVLTVKGRNDILHDQSLLDEVPPSVEIYQAKEFDPFSLLMFKRDHRKGVASSAKMKDRLLKIAYRALETLRTTISMPDIQIYWALPAIIKGIQVFMKNRYDTIITTSPPPSAHLIGLILSKITNKPWIVDFRDPWVDGYNFQTHKSLLRQSIEAWLEKIVVTNASAIIANTHPNKKVLLKRYNSSLSSSKVVTITNGFDKKLLDSVSSEKNIKFTICHTGVLYPDLEPFFFLDAFANWLNKEEKVGIRQNVQMLLVGSKDDKIKKIVGKTLSSRSCSICLSQIVSDETILYPSGVGHSAISHLSS